MPRGLSTAIGCREWRPKGNLEKVQVHDFLDKEKTIRCWWRQRIRSRATSTKTLYQCRISTNSPRANVAFCPWNYMSIMLRLW